MGMYTELCLGVRFKTNTPADVIAALDYMCLSIQQGVDKPTPKFNMSHPLFNTDRWDWMLRSGGSYYFNAQPCLVWRFDKGISDAWYLTVLTNIKNYNNEWEHFLNFIAPWVEVNGEDTFVGYERYEESQHPTLIYIKDGIVIYKEVE